MAGVTARDPTRCLGQGLVAHSVSNASHDTPCPLVRAGRTGLHNRSDHLIGQLRLTTPGPHRPARRRPRNGRRSCGLPLPAARPCNPAPPSHDRSTSRTSTTETSRNATRTSISDDVERSDIGSDQPPRHDTPGGPMLLAETRSKRSHDRGGRQSRAGSWRQQQRCRGRWGFGASMCRGSAEQCAGYAWRTAWRAGAVPRTTQRRFKQGEPRCRMDLEGVRLARYSAKHDEMTRDDRHIRWPAGHSSVTCPRVRTCARFRRILPYPCGMIGSGEWVWFAGECGEGGGDLVEAGPDVGGSCAGIVAGVGMAGVGAGYCVAEAAFDPGQGGVP